MSTRTEQRKQRRALDGRIDLICGALEKAEASRLLQRWRKEGPDEEAMEAMRNAVIRIDRGLSVTTDALAAAFEAGLRSFTRRRAQ